MKTALAILLLSVAVCSAQDKWITVVNLGDKAVDLGFDSGGGEIVDYYIGPSAFVYVPISEIDGVPYFSGFASWYDAYQTYQTYDGPAYPMLFLRWPGGYDVNLFEWRGQWPVSQLSTGFSLGLLVAGSMLLLWIVSLLKKPVSES